MKYKGLCVCLRKSSLRSPQNTLEKDCFPKNVLSLNLNNILSKRKQYCIELILDPTSESRQSIGIS